MPLIHKDLRHINNNNLELTVLKLKTTMRTGSRDKEENRELLWMLSIVFDVRKLKRSEMEQSLELYSRVLWWPT